MYSIQLYQKNLIHDMAEINIFSVNLTGNRPPI